MAEERRPRDDDRRKQRQLRLLVDVTAQVLAEDEGLTLCEGLRLVEAAKTAAVRLFPGDASTFDRVIRPRLEQILLERFGISIDSVN